MLMIWWIWKIEIWSEKLVDGYQTVPYQPGALIWVVNCLVVFPTHLNPNNSLLIILQIPLLFTCAPALKKTLYPECPKITQKLKQNRKTLVNVLNRGIWCCLKRERDIDTKAMLSDIKTALRCTPALKSERKKDRITLEIKGASVMPKILEISIRIQMERFVSVSSDRNIRDHLWRWSTYFGRNIQRGIRLSIFDKPVLCPY